MATSFCRSSVNRDKNGSKGNLCLLARNESLGQWFSELARGLTCPCKPVGRANGHKRKITPGTFAGLVLQVTVKADMSIDELARTYITNVERQQRAQSTGRFPWIRETSERASHFSAGTRLQSTSGGRIHCEQCGLRMNRQAVCSGCRASPTRLWLQFASLATLGVLTAYNYIFVLNLLSTLAPRGHVACVWLNVSAFTRLYGWIVLGDYLPACAYYGRRK